MFAYYLISSETVKKQLSAAAQQTKIRHTSPDKIKDCVVWIPDLKEQKHIASILSDLDKKIALNRAINQNLRARREQRENLFSLCRADGVNGDVSRNLEATRQEFVALLSKGLVLFLKF